MGTIREVRSDTALYAAVLSVADKLGQKKYIDREYPFARNRLLLAAVEEADSTSGFLLALVQTIGHEEGRPPILFKGEPLLECYVNAFGVALEFRRQGIGQDLQEAAIRMASDLGCYQMRSRSPVTAAENYGLKLKMGYAVHPSGENDSYYFIKVLRMSNREDG
jgi:GNAT superfamily N-acetyltransferase